MTSKKPVLKTFAAPSRLSKLVDRPGGLQRQLAIAQAARNVEELRAHFMPVLAELVEQLVDASLDITLDQERLLRLERIANRIITVAGTYGLGSLEEAAKRLCDLLQIFENRQTVMPEILRIHVDAVRLFSPMAAPCDDAAAAKILSELKAVLRYLDEPRGGAA